LANYGQDAESIQYEIRQLELQAAQERVPFVLPVGGAPDQPEIQPVPEIQLVHEVQPVESPYRQCSVLQEEVDSANDSLEFYKMKEAADLIENNKYDDTTTIYKQLSHVRGREIDRKWKAEDRNGADDTERKLLKIKYKLAIILKKQDKLLEAEVAINYI